MSKWNPVRYRSTIHGEDGEIRLAADGLWTHPDDPSLDPSPLVDADGRQLGPDPVRYTPGNSPERAETYLTEADATEKEGVTALCENMGLKPRHRTRVVRLLALMYWRGLFTDHVWEDDLPSRPAGRFLTVGRRRRPGSSHRI